MRIGLGALVVGALLGWAIVENASPGSTEPAAENTRTAAGNWMVTVGGIVSDGIHVAVPIASDTLNLAREEFPNVLGPPTNAPPPASQPAPQP